jgi:hypothetical protein
MRRVTRSQRMAPSDQYASKKKIIAVSYMLKIGNQGKEMNLRTSRVVAQPPTPMSHVHELVAVHAFKSKLVNAAFVLPGSV